ncbi:MAG: hypothetical protein KDC42_00295 [Ignavibacteriae bacterium]|nr:hypothetical protein [Ignavibacteriota bacterium]
MLEKFVESKIKTERARIDKYDDISKGDIRKSKLSAPVKRYILARFEGKLTGEEFDQLLTKAVKLNINYTIRPGWTLLNFLFSKYDSQQAEVIKEKSDVFTYYRFYIDFIVNYIDEHGLVVITKDKVARFIKEANRALHEKLVNNVTGVKVKNFFIQLYRLAEKNQEDVSLTSTVPVLFIKTFLEDKEYSDVLQKFNSIEDLTNETEIELKECIKIVSDKFTPPSEEKSAIVEKIDSTDIFPDEDEDNEKDEITIKNITEDANQVSGTEESDVDIEKDDVIIVDFDKKEAEDNEIETPGNENEVKIGEAEKEDPSKLPTTVISETNLDVEKKSISRLFKHSELVNICQVIYNGDKHKMHESFRELKEFSEWKDASTYLKDLFYDHNVDIYNKCVLLFVDVLNDYYNQIEG